MKQVHGIFVLFLFIVQVFCSPIPYSKQGKNEKDKVLIDQRQEGGVNVRADLKNFIILIIPKSIPEDAASSPGLIDIFRSHSKEHGSQLISALSKQTNNVDANEVGRETLHFIESKTAPYHVDISKSDSHLRSDEILATQTPPVALALKTPEENAKPVENNQEKTKAALLRHLRSTRLAKAFVLTVPEEDFVLTKMEDEKKVVKKDGLKNKSKKVTKEEMVLLGASEQCGPEMFRDAEGVCRLRKLFDSKELERDE